ncbi:MAG: S8 family serine peptidase, partial [Thermoplasmata archaeon]|nr:S8 family serine peptidase [Thermoplasmata archaeon]
PDLQNVIYTDGVTHDGDHGTCTTGIVFADGTDNIDAQGIAYEAVGTFADYATGRALTVTNLWNGDFNEGSAGMNGIVQSNSWGAPVTLDGTYTSYAAENDQAIWDNPNVLTLWASGNSNSGTSEGLLNVDSVAKNGMCIGAIFHKGTATMTDDEYVLQSSGNTPSRGPAADGRQKPDMCGPFDLTLTTDSVDGDGENGYATGNYYTNFGGTSGATPVVAGCTILAYEMYQENYFDNNPTNALPYASTVKALMIANAFQYDLSDATRTCQGWGTPDMEYMHNLGAEYHQMDEYPQALASGDSWSRNVYSDGAYPLKISLAWTEPAASDSTGSGRTLLNNLDLKVIAPGGAEYYGNNGLFSSLYSSSGTGANNWGSDHRDDLNNVENVFIQNPASGIWTIEISARTGDIAIGPQDFSLVASGGMIPITSQGMIQLDAELYAGEDTVQVTVMDSDLNTQTNSQQTFTIDIDSDTESGVETVLLTETGDDTGIFVGSKIISATDGGGILQVSHDDTITVTYDDANDGSGPATVFDTAIVDGGVASAGIQTVEWWGSPATEDLAIGYTDTLGAENTATSYTDTFTQDDNHHETDEILYGGGGQKFRLQADYTFSIDPSGTAPFDLFIDAYTSAEGMLMSYSINGGGAVSIGTLTATSDTDTYIQVTLTGANPDDSILVTFDDAVDEKTTIDTLYVDHLYILGGNTGNPTDHNTINWTLSSDDGAGANDVAQYNIYRADTPIVGAYLDSVPAGEDTYTDLDKGQIDGIQWYYVVRAEDIIGNEDTNVLAVPEPGGSPLAGYDIDTSGIAVGEWAFVSFAYVMNDDIEAVLADSSGTGTEWDIAKWYDPADANNPWKTYSINSPSLSDMPQINQNMGVWLHLTANDGTLTTSTVGDYSGSAIGITLQPGWNLVGYPSATGENAFDSLLGLGVNWIGEYQAASPYINDESDLTQVDLSEGNAYWIHVDALAVWTVDP